MVKTDKFRDREMQQGLFLRSCSVDQLTKMSNLLLLPHDLLSFKKEFYAKRTYKLLLDKAKDLT